MYDRRVNAFVTVNAYLFNAKFDDGLTAEIQVNPEFGGRAAALAEAKKYGEVIGRLPTQLRIDLQTVWIHKGAQAFGGGNNNLLIHTDQGALYEADGILEETFVHEACHTSLDSYHAAAPGWLSAQQLDGNFISTYARDNPDREDIAETFLPYLAVRYRSGRISESLADTIVETVPNRMGYFDAQPFDMYPIVRNPAPSRLRAQAKTSTKVRLKWKLKRSRSDATSFQIQVHRESADWEELATPGIRVKKLIVSGLEPGMTYVFRIRANGPFGPSGWSNERSVTLPD